MPIIRLSMSALFLFMSAIILFIYTSSSVIADDVEVDKLELALSNYQNTGEVKNCIMVRSIRSTNVIDDQHILFKAGNGKVYLNKLSNQCPRLGIEKRIGYRVTVGRLCDVDTVTVLSTASNISGPSCGLGKFEVYEKTPTEETS